MADGEAPQKHLLLVTDLAALGRAAALAALPVLNLAGHAVSLLPTAYFSAHTGGFGPVHRRDLAGDMEATLAHWQALGQRFDAILVSYAAGARQLELLNSRLGSLLKEGGALYVDPVMGDRGRRYAFCDEGLVKGFRALCARADLAFPNRTELALLLNLPLTEGEEPQPPLSRLGELGAKGVAVTGHTRGQGEIGVLLYSQKENSLYETFRPRYPQSYPGTGDLLAAAVTAALIQGASPPVACEMACDFLDASLRHTVLAGAPPRYGLAFERALPGLMEALGKLQAEH